MNNFWISRWKSKQVTFRFKVNKAFEECDVQIVKTSAAHIGASALTIKSTDVGFVAWISDRYFEWTKTYEASLEIYSGDYLKESFWFYDLRVLGRSYNALQGSFIFTCKDADKFKSDYFSFVK